MSIDQRFLTFFYLSNLFGDA